MSIDDFKVQGQESALSAAQLRSSVTWAAIAGELAAPVADGAAANELAQEVEVVACRAAGRTAHLLGEDVDVEIWHMPGREAWTGWLAAFNRGVTTADVRVVLPTPGAGVFDVWNGGYSRFYDEILAGIAPQDVLFLRYGTPSHLAIPAQSDGSETD